MMKTLISILLLFVIALGIHSSEYYKEDMVIHVPFIKDTINSSLYTNDLLVDTPNPQKNTTVYYSFMAFYTEVSPLPFRDDIKILYLVFVFLYISTLYFFATTFVKNEVAVIFVLLVILKIPIGGSGTSTMESEIIPRAIGTLASLASLYLAYKKKYIHSFSIFIISFFFHPLSAFYAFWIAVSSFIFLNRGKIGQKMIFPLCVLFLVGLTIFGVGVQSIDRHWLQIIQMRNTYAFMHMWSSLSWVYWILSLLPGVVFVLNNSREDKKMYPLIISCYAGALVLTVIHFIFTIYKPLQPVILLQIARIWYYPLLLSLLAFSVFFVRFIQSQVLRTILMASFFILIFAYRMTSINNEDFPWLETQKWAKNNTQSSCMFLVPFFSRSFRLESERPIVGDYKDGALSFYSKEFAYKWKQRMDELGQWEQKSDEEIIQLDKKYHFNYIVEESNNKRNFPVQYKNAEYIVYDLRGHSKCN